MFKSALIVVFSITCLSYGIELECEYVDIEFSDWGNKYTCKEKNLNIQQSNAIIRSAIGRHQNGKSDVDVKRVDISDQKTVYFPHGLGSIFPQLKSIVFQASELKYIKREDFKGLERLKDLSLFKNVIEVVPEHTFDDLYLLEVLWMDQNKLKIINPNIFARMPKLRRADFEGNECVNMNAATESLIEVLQNNIYENCGIPLAHQIETIKEKFNNLQFNLSKANQQISNLTKKLSVLIENSKKLPFYCDFHSNTSEYTCNARHLYVKNKNTTIGEVRGHHSRAYSEINVTAIHIHKQDTNYLPVGILKKFIHLRKLKVTKSNLVFLDNETFTGMQNVNELTLKENSIEIIPDYVFDELHSLQIMDLSYNRIQHLPPKIFYKLIQMEVLNLNGNNIHYVPLNLFSGNLILRNVFLENNNISSIGSTILQNLTETLIIADFRNNTCIDVKYPETTMDRVLIEILKCSELNDFIKKLLPRSLSSSKYIQLEATNEINNI